MEKKNIFSTGTEPSLREVLKTRENRARLEQSLVKRFLSPVLAFKLNIPGPVKNNDIIRQVFQKGCQEIQDVLSKHQWWTLYEKLLDLKTGPEYFCVVDIEDVKMLKIEMIQLEESPLGRLYDIDILHTGKDGITSIERIELGFSPRKCFICKKNAKECGRNRTHSVQEMQQKLEEIILKDGSMKVW
ncbi:citrate lyase holo-[acyl-carrier protein] synthase [Schnuerera sp. xch1]|uniref:citrate lyase holo-[acyl-carrier protein] synthase n=1 Tax=Schnuerera sp. xch1 TaxID=2874283 RepID=UPI001CC1BF16|nr:citrate lyase holo-[acyl-carrier protein] synthase [Schnuerera sp. xch1]MBZ2175049.1 citrate lyase holo-[acyl-carrier protein] synthase [Schnuerera sp. xch1]